MNTITIAHFRTRQVLFEGRFKSLRHTVEAAIRDGISLAFADLRHANLVNAEMDGAILDNAQLENANLLGANISEASLYRTSFRNARMHSAILCESAIDAAHFEGALFGATDIAGARMKRCVFDTLSALDLNFEDTAEININSFVAAHNQLCAFSRPPLTLKGLGYPIACLDHKLLVGHHAVVPAAREGQLPAAISAFMRTNRSLLESLWHTHAGTKMALFAA